MIPNLGATIAGVILVPAILAEEGLGAALIMLVVLLVYQQIENNVLTPKIQGKAVNLSGFFIIIAVTLFGSLLGVLGALTAVPLAGDDPDLRPGADEGTTGEGRRRERRTRSPRRGLAHLVERARLHVVDEAANLLLSRDEGARLDPGDRLADVLLEVVERLGGPPALRITWASPSLSPRSPQGFRRAYHASAGTHHPLTGRQRQVASIRSRPRTARHSAGARSGLIAHSAPPSSQVRASKTIQNEETRGVSSVIARNRVPRTSRWRPLPRAAILSIR